MKHVGARFFGIVTAALTWLVAAGGLLAQVERADLRIDGMT